MGARPVSGRPRRKSVPSWRLQPPHDRSTQGLVVSGFASLPTGRALFLEFGWTRVEPQGSTAQGGEGPSGAGNGVGGWLAALQRIAPVSDADGKDSRATALGFTWSGLHKMGLDPASLASFDRPFKEGMFQEDRLRRLGDRRGTEWLGTVIDGGPQWSGNRPAADATFGEAPVATPLTVHALLLLYTPDEDSAEQWCEQVGAVMAAHDVQVVHRLHLDLRPDERGIAREHFGFADGISQPVPFEAGVVAFATGEPVTQAADRWNAVPLGEVLMGHVNGHNEIAAGPMVADSDAAAAAGLAPHASAVGFRDLGHDGSYMVVRELRQYVAQFWNSHTAAAAKMRADDPMHADHVTADWIAERVVGRDLDGSLLCPNGLLAPDDAGAPANDFGFFDRDPHGFGCPAGSHVRRGNPRDGLAPTAADAATLLQAANNHRILRRGRKYGPAVGARDSDDGADRGLLFVALNTDITRQFEFVQQTWILNPNFANLYDETDPLIGPKGGMTIHETPLRRIVDVDTFVQMAGGDYFFLPSMKALDYFTRLQGEIDPVR